MEGRRAGEQLRVFIGLSEVAGYYRGLKSGFEELGIEATFLDLSTHRFDYGGSDRDGVADLIRACAKRREETRSRTVRVLWHIFQHALQIVLFLKALPKHDVFIFGFFSTFFFFLELPVLKLLGKKVVYQFHGSDSRPPYLNGAIMSRERGTTVRECIGMTRTRKVAIRVIERFADLVVDTPPQGHFHERPFVNWLHIGLPCRPASRAHTQDGVRRDDGVVRILHSPSRPEAKGSREIGEIMERLKSKGYAIEFVQIVDEPNSVVLEELRRCDFVVDQLYADYGMPGFATEAAWLGKPTVLGGYATDLWEALLPPEETPPTLYRRPDEIEAAIEKLVVDRDYRLEFGRRARAFVEERWSPRLVAGRYLSLLNGDFPEGWIYDPARIRYLHGCCLPEYRARELVAAVIREGGVRALRLRDKPELERAFVEFARGGTPGS